MKRFHCIIIIIYPTLLLSQSIRNFKIPDSLKNKNFKYVVNLYDNVYQVDNDKAEDLANIILLKGKKENNESVIFDGYYKIARTKNLKGENGYPYADTLIAKTKNINNNEYPAKAHILKGILYYNDGRYKEALAEYVIALKQNNNKNEEQFYYVKKLIAILKTATEEYNEALPLFLEYYQYEKGKINKDANSYISSIFSLANIYAKLKNYEKSIQLVNLGMLECKNNKNYSNYYYLLMIKGINQYYLKNYSSAEKTLLETVNGLSRNKDYVNLGIVYYYLGKVKNETKKENEAIEFFIKADSLSFVINSFEPVKRSGYEILIDYYKKKGDYQNQLKYVNRLIYSDSVITYTRKNLSKDISKKYDTPLLLQDKERLINKLNNKNKIYVWLVVVFLSITSFLIFILRKNNRKIKEYKKQAQALLEHSSNKIIPTIEKNAVENNLEIIQKKKNTGILLSDPKFRAIIEKIERFEVNNEFLKKNITLDSLAKDFGTNRDYLSKIINESKGKSFSQYINELRIIYIVNNLKSNEKLRKHTIAALADDIGYNNTETFTNAFKKITGTLPSYYIKLLNENK